MSANNLSLKCHVAESTQNTYTTAGRHGDLDGVATRLADIFEVERSVTRRTVDRSVDGQQRLVDTDTDGYRPVSGHLSVLVVVTLQL